jgi:hypothetical protein
MKPGLSVPVNANGNLTDTTTLKMATAVYAEALAIKTIH